MKPVKEFRSVVDLSKIPIEKWVRERMYTQGYRFVGKHSAIKICEWTKKGVRGTDMCYKNKFYRISSHRCVQMSPAAIFCDFNCLHCWRSLNFRLPEKNFNWDPPEEIYEGCLKAQREIVQGFRGKGYEKLKEEKIKEAEEPMHFAISLSGEPTLYPYLPEFIALLKKKGKTAFLVTNGAHPGMIKKLLPKKYQPTNLYVTLPGPDEKTFEEECCSKVPDGWKEINKTLSLLKKFSCRTVIRLTLNKSTNMHSPEKYAKTIEKYKPSFVECKGYMAIGGAREKLGMESMPWHEDLRKFAEEISNNCSYKIVDEKKNSCVVLLKKG
jgi:tRNA wybutosine-synthesizing protein 1